MSKPLNEEVLSLINTALINRKNEVLLQILELLEILKAKDDEKMARISSELTELLADESNLDEILKAKNLEELLNILVRLNENKMIKIYEKNYLKEKFPHLAQSQFIK
ncbi:hypothetical protein [Campylobacter cuniculorum]|uniref:Uncharacterized protein n=2 Tax=Campylobacter cuniculorum TaxID=374106 RepID=A0A1W6BYM4_9BACT|nr:hypothetical protein [Campylobacter cuniculorum]ARJ57175.1 hypothetical protein CCUN_1595 [Campylobacter cuniculorum DSM 23162 = LMG 24588]QOR04616.1 hypothetical protein A0071_01305 [Campylobacter cuniculorum]